MKTEILKRVCVLCKEICPGIGTYPIKSGTYLIDDLSFDSLMVMQLILAVEKEFGISFPNEKLKLSVVSRVGNIVDVIYDTLNK